MIPNLSNAATSNKDLYKKKKKKRVNRDQIPNLSNAAKSNKDLYANKNKLNSSTTKTKTKTTKLTGKERAQALARKRIKEDKTIAQVKAANKEKMRTRAKSKNDDFKKMRSGDMSKAAFIKKYPNSQTAKKSGVTTKRTITSNNNKKVVKKKTDKPYKKLTEKQFNKKFDVKKGDSNFRKYKKSGGLPGLINRRLKILKNMSAEDFRLNKKKKK